MTESPPAAATRYATFDLDEVRREKAALDEQIARLTRRRDGLAGVLMMAGDPACDLAGGDVACVPPVASAGGKRPTHRAMLVDVLRDAPGPMGVRELIDAVQNRFGEAIPRTSVSPLLRKLARRDEVEHVPDLAKWRIGAAGGEVVRFRGPKVAASDAA